MTKKLELFAMGDFPEKLKKMVRKKADFKCCRCHRVSVEVHHIIPQKDDGPDDFDNAAPLCPNCHASFGDNPVKRKEIREMRDHWYQRVEEMYKNVVLLIEKPQPRALKEDFPAVFFYHKKKGSLYLGWTNEFIHYYLLAAGAISQLVKADEKITDKMRDDAHPMFFTYLVEWLIFCWLAQTYFGGWIYERTKWRFPWFDETRFSPVKTPGIESATVNYLEIEELKENPFYGRNPPFEKFVVPRGTTVSISRDSKSRKSTITMKNGFYRIQFEVSYSSWFFEMHLPEWLSGLPKQLQKDFAMVQLHLSFRGEPNMEKKSDLRMGFHQKWAEDLCQEFQERFDWLRTLNNIREQQIWKIREIVDSLRSK